MKVLNIIAAAAVFAIGATVAGPAFSQDNTLGEEIFLDRCAICHGAGGSGDGTVGVLLDIPPKDLKILARENNGAFPFSEVFQAIDGRRRIDAHGNSKMPIWGEYFMVSAIEDPRINEKDARYITQGRILALVYFLESIQVH